MTLPEDRISDEAEQVVLSATHLQSLLDDFVVRQPIRRKMKVMIPSRHGIIQPHRNSTEPEGKNTPMSLVLQS